MARLKLVDKIPDETLDPRMQTNLGRALFVNPDLCLPFKALAAGVHLKSHLEARLRELVVLRISAALKSDVEWGQHVRVATTTFAYPEACMTLTDARNVRDGKLDGFTPREQMAMEYALAFDANAVDDALWNRAAEHFSQVELLDLNMLAGLYGLAGRLTNALAVPMDEGIHPISAIDQLVTA